MIAECEKVLSSSLHLNQATFAVQVKEDIYTERTGNALRTS